MVSMHSILDLSCLIRQHHDLLFCFAGISSLLKIVLGSRLLQYLWRCLFKGNGSYENGVTSNFLASPGNSGAALETAELSLSTALLKLKEAEAQQKGHVLKTRAAAAHAAYVAAEANTAVEAAEVAAAEAQRDLEKALAAQAAADEAATTKAGNPTMATSAAVISTAAAKINIRKPSISTAETRCETPTVTSRAHRAAESAPSRPLAQPIVAAKKAVVVEVEVVEPTRGLTKQNSAAIAFARPFFGEALKRGRSLVARPEVAPQMVHETAMGGQRMRYDTKQNFPRSWPQGLSGTLCAVLD